MSAPGGGAKPTVRINGLERPLEQPGVSLEQLLADLGRDPLAIAVELNGSIVRRPAWRETRVESGDRLEIVQFVQGGLGLRRLANPTTVG